MTPAFGFLKFCRVLLNIVCGYPTGNGCVVCLDLLTSDCVIFAWVVPSVGFNILLGLICVVAMGCFYMQLLGTNFQCFKYLKFCASSQKHVTDTFLFVVFRFFLE